ncbi:FtsL-like putative cell division protein [Hoylesella oralis]|uniref:FtsL-like putative cell division protein n=1 Tax=Hoylesella oralis TaxID=28134 RepID=UPI0028EFC817|nr:FtsL-like putative cell division protein [Hoylesella oralis]
MSKDKDIENNRPKLTIENAPDTERTEQEAETTEQRKPEEEAPTLKEIIREQATEDELPLSKNFTLRKILGGDILTTSTIRRQIWVFMLITFFMIVYISNRYSCQQDLIEIDNLQKELQDAKYRALSSNSQLTEKSRESHVLELLKSNKDSVLKIANQPPYIINVPDK